MWKFAIINPGTPERNPRETEFFRITGQAEALIREFIQNSLDAKLNNEQAVTIKITFRKVRSQDISQFLDDELKQHLIACGFLDGRGYPETVPCLILEDFGTTGLDGPFTPDAGTGNFYNFWWREGISQKAQQKAGRWGLGKTTFHIISKYRTFFGLTVRSDRNVLLMGKALLKTHILNNHRYHYFGYFSENNFMPLKNGGIIQKFKYTFGIKRNEETGLSLVIPVPEKAITFDSVLESIIRNYYYPIIANTLRVELHEGSREEELNKDNLIEKAAAFNWKDTEWEEVNVKEILQFIKTAITIQPVTLNIQDPDNPAISEHSFGDQMNAVKESFRGGNPCKFKVPVSIKKTDEGLLNTFITIILKRFPGLKKPFEGYFRSGILITEIRMLGNRPVAGLLIAEDKPVCEYLGDCETPAHTNWNERTEGFTEKYINATRTLRFIKKSFSQIVSILDEPSPGRQVDFLKDIFSIPVSHREPENGNDTIRVKIPEIPENSGVFIISIIKNGFSITLNKQVKDVSFPFKATVRMAYDTRRGNPFAQYEEFDFDVGSNLINISTQDCNVLVKKQNKLEIEVIGNDFRIEVTGFDPRRDLVVDIERKEQKEISNSEEKQ